MSDSQFSVQVFLPTLHKLEAPLEEAAKTFLVETYPDFPTDPNAYW